MTLEGMILGTPKTRWLTAGPVKGNSPSAMCGDWIYRSVFGGQLACRFGVVRDTRAGLFLRDAGI